jgi:peptidoglycan lytic transglycosylase G
LAIDSPYNTRTHTGLPPGPIDSPGLASIEAAARPAKAGYLFYVVKPGACGEHSFSSTEAQFEADVSRYDEARAAAGGESPDSCG